MTSAHGSSVPRTFLQAVSESRFNYGAAYVVDLTCAVLFGYLGVREHASWPWAALSWIIGAMLFSLAEYSIHRWLLHNPKSFFFPLHAAHHEHPDQPAGFFFFTSIVVLSVIWLMLRFGFRYREAGFLISGFAAAYFYYGVLHHVEHTTRINQIPFRWLQKRWAEHSVHHRLDATNFGVTTSFWDHVFKTQYKSRRKGVSGR